MFKISSLIGIINREQHDNYKTIHIFLIFIAVVIVQLFVLAKIIFDKEAVLKTGTVYKFKTRPIDPSDPFKGKYVICKLQIKHS